MRADLPKKFERKKWVSAFDRSDQSAACKVWLQDNFIIWRENIINRAPIVFITKTQWPGQCCLLIVLQELHLNPVWTLQLQLDGLKIRQEDHRWKASTVWRSHKMLAILKASRDPSVYIFTGSRVTCTPVTCIFVKPRHVFLSLLALCTEQIFISASCPSKQRQSSLCSGNSDGMVSERFKLYLFFLINCCAAFVMENVRWNHPVYPYVSQVSNSVFIWKVLEGFCF